MKDFEDFLERWNERQDRKHKNYMAKLAEARKEFRNTLDEIQQEAEFRRKRPRRCLDDD
ncbi:MAG: hypothetical protein V1896_02190 [Candidatus Zambryskibacteria bacterium]